ncbi:CHAT domain-containing protein [Mycena capillaripes]|nr:CHAT domain-containing protein [Mycena capillaripes]
MIPKMEQLILQTLPGDQNLPSYHQALGKGFTKKYITSGNLDDIQAAVKNFQAALEHGGHPNKSSLLHDLAIALQHRFWKLGNSEDLDAILKADQEALDQGHPQKAELSRNLSILFGTRYKMLGNLKDLDAALEQALGRIDLIPVQADWVEHVAALFSARYERTGNLQDLNTIVEKRQQVVDLIPHNHPTRADCLLNVSITLLQRYEKLDNLEDLDMAIQTNQEAMALTSKEHPARAIRLQNLAISLGFRYKRLGDLRDSELALQANLEAVHITPQGHPRWGHLLGNLAMLFKIRYDVLADMKDLEGVLQIRKTLLSLTPKGHPNRASHLHNLAESYNDRYKRKGDLNDLQVAVQMQQEARDLTPNGDPHQAARMMALAVSLGERYKELGDVTDVNDAVQLTQEVIDLTPNDHPDRAIWLKNIGMILLSRFERQKELQDLETALQIVYQAEGLSPKGHSHRAGVLKSLLLCLEARYRTLGDLQDSETGLQIGRELIELTPPNHPDRMTRLQNLATLFSARFRKLGDLQDLHGELSTAGEAVKLAPEDHPERAGLLFSLASSFKARHDRLGNVEDLKMAIHTHRDAIALLPHTHSDRPTHLARLAESCGTLYQKRGDLRNLNEALDAIQEAMHSIPQQDIGLLSDLALILGLRYTRKGDLKDLQDSLNTRQQVVELTPPEHPARAYRLNNLAISFRLRYQRLGNLNDLQVAIERDREAIALTPHGDPVEAVFLYSLALSLQERYRKSGNPDDLAGVHSCYIDSFKLPSTDPHMAWPQAIQWATFATEFQSSYCVPAYTAAFALLPELLWIGNSIPVRHRAILDLNIQEATSAAIRTCIHLSNLRDAVKFMEQGLATIFQQMLQLKPDVEALPPDQAEKLSNFSAQLRDGTSEAAVKVVDDRNKLLLNIREKPEFEFFLLPKTFDILRHASQGGPIVILNSHPDGCDGIVIANPTSEPVHIPFPSVTLDILKSKREALKELLARCNVRTRDEAPSSRLFGHRENYSPRPTEECFEELLSWLWTDVVGPIYGVLNIVSDKTHSIWWLPIGAFTGLPLHASAQTDKFIHSYTVTLGSLLDAYNKKSASATPKVTVVGVTHTGPGRRNFLNGVGQEVKKIISIVKEPYIQCLEGEQATVDAVKMKLQHCSWAYLACHGSQVPNDPAKSYLHLYGGNLELQTILRMPLSNAQCVFLAACETAMGDAQLMNESFHLGGGFIAAGFRGAIGTMWSMNDVDGPLVAETVYSHLFRNGECPEATAAAQALQLAIQRLKDQSVSYERWIPFIHMGV